MTYGAYGYTGKLIVREAVRRGHKPALTGRSLEKIRHWPVNMTLKPWASAWITWSGHPAHQSFLASFELCGALLHHCGTLMQACITAGANYLDITDEIEVFELAQSLKGKARSAGIMICSVVGFDDILIDYVAASLKAALPDATHLALGFDSRSGFSLGYRENLSRKLIKACIAKTVKGLDKSARANTTKLVLCVENRIGCYSRINFKYA